MEKYFPLLQAGPLFTGLTADDIKALLGCLAAVKRRFKKNSFVWTDGDPATAAGLVLSGAVHVLKDDFWGRRLILSRLEPGALFGESFLCAGLSRLPVSVQAALETDILFLDCRLILAPCRSVCARHAAAIRNLARMMAEKNLFLTRKLEQVSRSSLREKLMSYLSEQARLAGSGSFDLPFSRQELADYLGVDRSALSAALSKMRAEGLLRCRRGHFELTGPGLRV